ncbi:hypothetical protein [Nocardia sp. NPDC052566]
MTQPDEFDTVEAQAVEAEQPNARVGRHRLDDRQETFDDIRDELDDRT